MQMHPFDYLMDDDSKSTADRKPVGPTHYYVVVGVLSSVITAVVIILATPRLIYPQIADLIRPDIQRVERKALEAKEAVSATRYLGSGGAVPALNNGDPSAANSSPAVAAAERVGPSVVGIFAEAASDKKNNSQHYFYGFGDRSSGSGVIIDAKGYIVTNHHVVDNAVSIQVVLHDGRRVKAKLVGYDPATDLAILKIEADRLIPAVMGDSDTLRVGEPVLAIGNPVSLEFQRTVTAGIISGLNRGLRTDSRVIEVIQTDAAISPGNSGGPLADMAGRVIGITTAKISLPDVEGMGFAVPINTVKRIATQIISQGKVTRPWLGVAIKDVLDGADMAGQMPEKGVAVADIVAGGPAEQGGMMKGDTIVSVDGKPVDSYLALRKILETKQVGDQVLVTVKRMGKELTLTVILGQMPDS